jgi:hypothetical protein
MNGLRGMLSLWDYTKNVKGMLIWSVSIPYIGLPSHETQNGPNFCKKRSITQHIFIGYNIKWECSYVGLYVIIERLFSTVIIIINEVCKIQINYLANMYVTK